ncbi:hypothetical protein AB0D67_14920 [Streptosporangium sp. NPDC048047]|uniref:hypothetical protein n=1 Tax=Streptosporangium sp. NPDC048047 TaxID=3155748 RepID=UPI00342E812A
MSRVRAVRLRRRDADDLVLMTAERVEGENEVIDLTARLLAALFRDEAGGAEILRRVLPDVLPWTRFLPAPAVEEFLASLSETAPAAASLGNLAPVTQLLVEWRHTAEIHADPRLLAALTAPRGNDFGPVPRPKPSAGGFHSDHPLDAEEIDAELAGRFGT